MIPYTVFSAPFFIENTIPVTLSDNGIVSVGIADVFSIISLGFSHPIDENLVLVNNWPLVPYNP